LKKINTRKATVAANKAAKAAKGKKAPPKKAHPKKASPQKVKSGCKVCGKGNK